VIRINAGSGAGLPRELSAALAEARSTETQAPGLRAAPPAPSSAGLQRVDGGRAGVLRVGGDRSAIRTAGRGPRGVGVGRPRHAVWCRSPADMLRGGGAPSTRSPGHAARRTGAAAGSGDDPAAGRRAQRRGPTSSEQPDQRVEHDS
jgi:hypothetical protein